MNGNENSSGYKRSDFDEYDFQDDILYSSTNWNGKKIQSFPHFPDDGEGKDKSIGHENIKKIALRRNRKGR